ncbi:MAG: serine protease [Rhodomicrobium sp.]
MRGAIVYRLALWLSLAVCFWALFSFPGAGYSLAGTACADPAAYVRGVAGITRHFSDEEKKTDAGLLGARGTAWFLSAGSMVTAAHVAQAMHLSGQTWTQIEVAQVKSVQPAYVRIQRIAGSGTEKIAVLELRTGFTGAKGLQIRTEPFAAGERVVSVAYPANVLRFAQGRFIRYGDEGKISGAALLEMYDGNDRLVLDHGASGAPVLDCEGRVVAVVSNIFAKTMTFMSQAIRVSTAWGNPNIASVPIAGLEGASTAK